MKDFEVFLWVVYLYPYHHIYIYINLSRVKIAKDELNLTTKNVNNPTKAGKENWGTRTGGIKWK